MTDGLTGLAALGLPGPLAAADRMTSRSGEVMTTALTIRPEQVLTPGQQAMIEERARREGVCLSTMMLRDCLAATEQASHRRRVGEAGEMVAARSAALYRRLA